MWMPLREDVLLTQFGVALGHRQVGSPECVSSERGFYRSSLTFDAVVA